MNFSVGDLISKDDVRRYRVKIHPLGKPKANWLLTS